MVIIGLLMLVGCLILKKLVFHFQFQKAKEIYCFRFAHRGFHMLYPENTIEAYEAAIKAGMGIELDIRYLKDGTIICFHDRYTKRLLSIPGKITMFDEKKIKRLYVQGSKSQVPCLEEALMLIHGQVPILVEVKGNISKAYLAKLKEIIDLFDDENQIFFHVKNIRTYFILSKVYPNRVFWILNLLRKRFDFVKGRDYHVSKRKYFSLLQDIDFEIPSPEDMGQLVTQAIQKAENKNELLAKIGGVINQYETRIDETHWVNQSLWLHRGIVDSKYPEHSKENFLACIQYARKNKVCVTVEFDVMMYKGEIRCYHKDKISSFLGQNVSSAEKLKLENSLTLGEILQIFEGQEKYINLAIDIKDYHILNRELPQMIIYELENSNFHGNFILMSYNPFVLNYFKRTRKDYLRAQIGHSLSGLRKVPFFRFPWILNGLLGILFDIGNADCTLFDNNDWIFWMIALHRNIKGKPVLIYAPKNYLEMEAFVGKESISNFIIENITNQESWQEEYIEKFKKVV